MISREVILQAPIHLLHYWLPSHSKEGVRKLWMGAELQDDVSAKHRAARAFIEERINVRLAGHAFESPWEKWAFVSIIMRSVDAYKDVAKKQTKTQTLEFRLRLDHSRFKKATQEQANKMVLEALARSVDKVSTMDVTDQDIKFLSSVFDDVTNEV